MIYYDLSDNGQITGFTELEWVAEIKGYRYTTDENIVMQKDGSGYVFESQYDDTLEPIVGADMPTIDSMINTNVSDLREAVEANNDALIALMFGGDENVS